MFRIITFMLCLIALTSSYGQSFEVTNENNLYVGEVGDQISAPITIRNLTSQPLKVVIKRLNQVIGTSQASFMCWGKDCGQIETEEILSNAIAPYEASSEFKSILETGLVQGVSSVKYLIYNKKNPQDRLIYEINYTINEEDAKSKSLYSSDDIILKEIYPNPVVDFAIISYELKNVDTEAKIVLHNVLGSIVNEYELNPYERSVKMVTENLNPGVYFYSLYLDGDGVMTHKLIIRN